MTQSIDSNSNFAYEVNEQINRLQTNINWCNNEKRKLEDRLTEANDELSDLKLWAEMADAKPEPVDAYTPFENTYHSEIITKNYTNIRKVDESITDLEYQIHNFDDSIVWYYESLLKLYADWIIE